MFAYEFEGVKSECGKVCGFVWHASKYIGVEVDLYVLDQLLSVKDVDAFGDVVSEDDVAVMAGVGVWFALRVEPYNDRSLYDI